MSDKSKMFAITKERRENEINRYNRYILELVNAASMPHNESDKKILLDEAIRLSRRRNSLMQNFKVECIDDEKIT